MNEIEEFLKRAAEMRARQAAGQAAPGQIAVRRPPVPPTTVPSPAAPQRLPLTRRPFQDDSVLDAEVVDAEEVSGDKVANYVSQHLDTGTFRERSSRLGEAVKSTDEAIESHLHQTFEHRLGQLGGVTSRAEDSTLDDDENAAAQRDQPQPAVTDSLDLLSMLRSPRSLQQAILLSEIFTRPQHRW